MFMLRLGEDGWIYERDVKLAVLEKLTENDCFDDKLVFEISRLLKHSIESNQYIYFHF